MNIAESVVAEIKSTIDELSHLVPHYTRRTSQLTMVNDIRNILCRDQSSNVIVCEAGTGVGKTMAYLLGVIPHAKLNNKSVVISTATVTLQEQIINKDLPLFQAAYHKPLSVALAKGRQRYVCADKLNKALGTQQPELDFEEALFHLPPTEQDMATLRRMASKLETNDWNGDIDSWNGELLPEPIWSAVASDANGCKVSFSAHKFCPFHIARSELSGADIIVANHSLVAMDLQLGGGVLLPSVDEAVYVFDEAHRMPDIVRDATASTMSLSSTLSVLESLNKLADKRKLTAALSPSLSQRISDEIKVNANDLIKSLRALQDFVATNEEVLFHGSQFHRFELGTIPNVFESLLLDVQTSTKAVRRTLGKTGNHLKAEIIDEGSNLVAEKGLSDLSFFIGRIDLVWTTTNLLMTHHTAGIQPAKWLERRDGKLYLAASEVSVGNSLLSWLWKKNSGVILTSATLRSLSVFDTYLSSTGLNLANHAAVFCRVYESPFDYQSQAKLIMPINLPFEPNDAEYVTWLKHIMFNLIKGEPSSLVIFTSHAQMQAVRTAVEHSCTTSKILLQCQGDASRQAILENHAKAIEQGLRSVLFGVNSMAEGLDLRGDLLTNLIIVRLPFEMPESPIAAAHMEYEKYLGNNAFYTVTLPKASIALIQSVGRLIRSENDSGKCTILDKRIQTKNYGEDLLCSLPPMSREYRQVT